MAKRGALQKRGCIRVNVPSCKRGALPSAGMLVGRVVVSPKPRQGSSCIPRLHPTGWPRAPPMCAAWPHLDPKSFSQQQKRRRGTPSPVRRGRPVTEHMPKDYKRPLTQVGTLRCCGTTHYGPEHLTKRTRYDLGACLRFAKVYWDAVGDQWQYRYVVSPAFAEYLVGLPEGWTGVDPLPADRVQRLQPGRARQNTVLDIFSGCLGMGLGLKNFFRTVAYVERDTAVRRVIEARVKDGSVDAAPVFGDVQRLHARMLKELPDALAAGFPCTDVSTAGLRQGFDGPDSVLFREVIRLVEEIIALDARKARWLVLENVAAITQSKMQMVWREVLGSLARLGYRAAWVTISARNVGCFMNRSRWILVAVRGGAAPLPCPPLTQAGLQKLAEARWNQSWPVAPPPATWLVSKDQYASECAARLKMCGNCVVPLQVRAAVQALSSLAF